jgi:hypothetical protein
MEGFFLNTRILITRYGPGGASGLILNKSRVFPVSLNIGGPVNMQSSLHFLHNNLAAENATEIIPGVMYGGNIL